jgi:hypothetical protein
MKKKIIFIPFLLIMFLFIFSVQPVMAELVFATCSVDRVGQTPTGPAGRFTDVNGIIPANQYFTFDASNAKELLATALTALSLNKDVVLRFESSNYKIVQIFIDN